MTAYNLKEKILKTVDLEECSLKVCIRILDNTESIHLTNVFQKGKKRRSNGRRIL